MHTAMYYPDRMKRAFGVFLYSAEKICPRCGSLHVHRTRRGRVLEWWVLLLVPVLPYRCGKCRLRFYGPKKNPSSSPVPDFEEDHTNPKVRSSRHSGASLES